MGKKLKLDNLSAEELRDLASPLTEKELKQINKVFEPYIFYRNLKDGTKECFCSACNKHYVVSLGRSYSVREVEFLSKKHNENACCPKCLESATMKNIGKIKNAGNLWEEKRVVTIEIKNKNAILLKCYYAEKCYSKDVFWSNKWHGYIAPEICGSDEQRFLKNPEANLSKVYLLQPGNVQSARLDSYMWSYARGWYLKDSHREPFVSYMGCGDDYFVIGKDKIEKTFLKYAPFRKFKKDNGYRYNGSYTDYFFVTFLCRSAELPALEILVKLGFCEPVDNLISGDRYYKRLIDWNALKPWDIFKLPKVEYKELEKFNDRYPNSVLGVLKVYRDLQRLKITGGMKNAIEIFNFAGKSDWIYKDRVLPYLKECKNFTKFKNYIFKNANKNNDLYGVMALYSDYINMAKKLQYDLKNDVVLFPKNLIKAHNTADDTWKIIEEQKRKEKDKALVKEKRALLNKYKRKYQYIGEKYSIILPEYPEDIIKEGKFMQHCVGGYVERHYNGALCICFLRKNDDIDTPFYTIEMRGKELGQVQRMRNAKPTFRKEDAEVKAFFDEWLEWVENGSKRKKEKNAKTNAA